MEKNGNRNFIKTIGPGLLFASTAIGVSHLVQSTRAGAEYGFALAWAVVLANVLKYPFFEYGSRYAAAMGESLIDGYHRMGRSMLLLYTTISLATMFFVTAAVGAVTAGFLHQLFGLEGLLTVLQTTYLLFAICLITLFFGQYKLLDSLIKVVGIVLLISTIAALASTLWRGPTSSNIPWHNPDFWNPRSLAFPFLIAFMGWMPTAVDLSAWNSLWTIERNKKLGYAPSLRATLKEFNIGYWISAILAPCFMILGAFLIYGSESVLPNGAAAFAGGIIELYTQSIGEWSRLIISAAAFSIMFGTCITVFDGYARVGDRLWHIYRPAQATASSPWTYRAVLILVGIGALIVIQKFGNRLRDLVDLATAISFIVAPIVAYANFRLVLRLPPEARPGRAMRVLSWCGLIFLVGFSSVYLYSLIFV
jgi:Mn2+/Fe2+ NRAMP family transporter